MAFTNTIGISKTTGQFRQPQPRIANWLACYRMGNGPRAKNGQEMAGEMAGGHLRGGSKMAAKWPDRQKIAKFWLSSHLPGHFGTPPEKWPPAISLVIARPFLALQNKKVECWISGNHRNHGSDENHRNPGCKARSEVLTTSITRCRR